MKTVFLTIVLMSLSWAAFAEGGACQQLESVAESSGFIACLEAADSIAKEDACWEALAPNIQNQLDDLLEKCDAEEGIEPDEEFDEGDEWENGGGNA